MESQRITAVVTIYLEEDMNVSDFMGIRPIFAETFHLNVNLVVAPEGKSGDHPSR